VAEERKPSIAGVRLPPAVETRRLPTRSEVPAEADYLERVLRDVKAGQERIAGELAAERGRDLTWRSEVEERLEKLEAIARAWEGLTLEIRELKIEQRTLVTTVIRNAQDDVVTARELGQLKADLARSAIASGEAAGTTAGHNAGRNAGRAWGAAAVAFSILLTAVEKCGPAVLEAIKK